MEALFVELPPFERHRAEYFTDDEFREFQQMLLKNPLCGDVIQHTGGLR
ncbi:toxin, partial [Escherichia coli]|nr:toxin [Escherichia coli]